MSNLVIFNWGYYPAKTYGGPAISIENIVRTLINEFESITVICNAHELNSSEKIEGIKANSICKGLYGENILYLDEEHKNVGFIKEKLAFLGSVDLIYVNSFFAWKQLSLANKLRKIYGSNMLIAPRGELEKNALAIKAPKKKIYNAILRNFLNRDDIFFHATNELEKENIKKHLKIKDERVLILDNIPSLPSENFYEKLNKTKLENHLDLVFISRIQSKKNLKYALECLDDISEEITIKFDIYGPIENEEYFDECKAVAQKLADNINVNYKGLISHEDVFNTFSKYDLFFFPTLSENFGHVIAEALASKVLVLTSDQTPWNDINMTNAGRAIPLESKTEFSKYISDLAKVTDLEYKNYRDQGLEYLEGKLNTDVIKDKYRREFKNITKQ